MSTESTAQVTGAQAVAVKNFAHPWQVGKAARQTARRALG